MLKLRKTRRTIALTAATLALAGGATIATAGAAHADSCGGYSTSYGASVGVCFSGSGSTSGYISWNINTSGSRTDERMYFTLHSNCRSWTWSVNDYQGPDSSSASAYCSSGGFWASSYSTESGNRSGGPIELF
ncbi:hypothetical protein ABIA33_000540 [Streptacidiphilus sp. MAP12-16]|uniref:hypothetical protein n=1 Tax=Streptacidiphilus sp. MAP12-16 TaxID=3156300 RepID=UPI00351220FB